MGLLSVEVKPSNSIISTSLVQMQTHIQQWPRILKTAWGHSGASSFPEGNHGRNPYILLCQEVNKVLQDADLGEWGSLTLRTSRNDLLCVGWYRNRPLPRIFCLRTSTINGYHLFHDEKAFRMAHMQCSMSDILRKLSATFTIREHDLLAEQYQDLGHL